MERALGERSLRTDKRCKTRQGGRYRKVLEKVIYDLILLSSSQTDTNNTNMKKGLINFTRFGVALPSPIK
jgi:hypothetical protein